ncbi:glycosyltransferase [Candidatus Oleimmundimicrobium sp.]|uniref:CgeB family protein n=1 Tax=Candidatus Oleimmundimicrobium sp. TaxID=3060597 RepID=UPI00271E56C9|nr:glycosyltransferase [Candidatus Oleimmundimicrobium sp.]MDO8885720.1 glycosyltransferase [Candidatus Oleimmundimicrobium sp.]
MNLLYVGRFAPDEYSQIPDESLVQKGFCDTKFVYLGYFNSEEGYWGTPNEFFIKKQLKRSGNTITILSKNNIWDLKKVVDKVNPDVILFSFLGNIDYKRLKDVLSATPAKKVMWTFDWMFLERRLPLFLKQGKLMDLVVTTEDVVDWSHYGLNHTCIRQGVDKALHKKVAFSKRYANDLVFVGNVYNKERVNFLRKVANKYQLKVYGNNCSSDLENGGRVFNDDLCKVYSSCKIALGDNSQSVNDGYWSNRVYLALGCGAFFLTPYVKGLEEEFENYKHLVWYKTEDEMFYLIDRFLKDEKKRKQIALNGYEFVHKNYSYEKRTKKLIKEIEKLGIGDNLLH